MRFLAAFACFVLILGFAGCGGASPQSGKPPAPAGGEAQREADAAPETKAAMKAAGAPADRKIIYTATMVVVVKDLEEVIPRIESLVAAHKDSFIARSEITGDAGSRRTATYTIRVPVDALQPAREVLLTLGSVERNALDSQDVTEEYVDVQARIKNFKEQEDKLTELLKAKRKEEKLEDIIRVSDRIAEVRRDVERVQGRLNYLSNMTTLATINLTLREIKDYKPPTAPTFWNRITGRFGTSWEALVDFGQELVLVLVGLVPWLPVLIPVGFAAAWGIGRYRRRRPVAQAAAVPIQTPPGPHRTDIPATE
jgi:hypothetical protein